MCRVGTGDKDQGNTARMCITGSFENEDRRQTGADCSVCVTIFMVYCTLDALCISAYTYTGIGRSVYQCIPSLHNGGFYIGDARSFS